MFAISFFKKSNLRRFGEINLLFVFRSQCEFSLYVFLAVIFGLALVNIAAPRTHGGVENRV